MDQYERTKKSNLQLSCFFSFRWKLTLFSVRLVRERPEKKLSEIAGNIHINPANSEMWVLANPSILSWDQLPSILETHHALHMGLFSSWVSPFWAEVLVPLVGMVAKLFSAKINYIIRIDQSCQCSLANTLSINLWKVANTLHNPYVKNSTFSFASSNNPTCQ